MTQNDNENKEPSAEAPIEKPEVSAKENAEEAIKKVGIISDIYSRLVSMDGDIKEDDDMVVVPSGARSVIEKFISDINDIDVDGIEDLLSDKELISIGVNHVAGNNAYLDDALSENANSDMELVNSVEYADRTLGIRKVDVNASGKLSGANAVAKFTSALGIGKHVCITLWHSGFSLVIAPPKESDIVSMHYTIAKLEQKLGVDTNNFIYSNYGVVINKILLDFILRHVVSSSLSIPEDASYLDYIKVTDLNTLAIGMATSIKPDGYTVTATCKNTLKLVNDRPLCDYTTSATIIPENLLWVNRGILTPELLEHISKTTPNSHTVDSVMHYQKLLSSNDEHDVTVIDGNDSDITFTIQTPTLAKYISSGEYWINKVISDAEELFADGEDEAAMENKIDTMVVASVLNKYNSYIRTIKVDDAYVDDPSTINTLLEVMSSDGVITNKVLSHIMEHINKNYVSLVATYDFNCPVCAEAGRDPGQGTDNIKGFKEFIPLNAVDHFFDLSTLKFTRIMKREK